MYPISKLSFQPSYNIGLDSLYNISLTHTIESVTALNKAMDMLNTDLVHNNTQKRLTATTSDHAYAVNGKAGIATNNNVRSSAVENELSAIVHSIESVTTSMNELFGSMKMVKGVLDIVDGVINGENEGERFSKGQNRISKTVAGLEFFTAAIAAGEAVSTPVTYAAVGSFLSVVAEGILAAQKQKNKDGQNIVSPEFMTQGLGNGNEYVTSVASRQELIAKQKSKSELKHKEDLLIAGWMKNAGTIVFDEEQVASNPTYGLALAKALNMNLGIKNTGISGVVFDDAKQLNAFKDHFDKGRLFPKSLRPLVPMPYVETNYLMRKEGVRRMSVKEQKELSAKGKNIGLLTPDMLQYMPPSKMTDMHMQQDEKYVLRYVDKLQQKFDRSVPVMQRKDALLSWFNNAEKAKDVSREADVSKSGGEQSRAGSGNVVHFNKSLIEHFTLHVNDSKEGVRDLKRKVEEVLIEILNSVNTIN